MKINYVLTTFSPAMFGEGATAHIQAISSAKARELVDEHTKVVATRAGHERLAKSQLPGCSEETGRYAQLRPGTSALHLHYRGPHIGDDGELPFGGVVTFYLIEAVELHEAE